MGTRIYLTGRVCLEVDGDIVAEERQFRGRQGRLVFGYLALNRTRPVTREELARIVWPGEMALAWEAALSSLMSRLRRVLGADRLVDEGVSLSGRFGQYQLHLPTHAWADIEAGASAIDEAEGALRAGEYHRLLGPATVAANIARRPFLSGVEGDWVESLRRRQERQLIRALDCFSEMWLHSEEPGLAVESATEAIGLDSLRERSHGLLMRAYAMDGNRAEAVTTYHRLRGLLASELGTDPSSETEELYLKLLG